KNAGISEGALQPGLRSGDARREVPHARVGELGDNTRRGAVLDDALADRLRRELRVLAEPEPSRRPLDPDVDRLQQVSPGRRREVVADRDVAQEERRDLRANAVDLPQAIE